MLKRFKQIEREIETETFWNGEISCVNEMPPPPPPPPESPRLATVHHRTSIWSRIKGRSHRYYGNSPWGLSVMWRLGCFCTLDCVTCLDALTSAWLWGKHRSGTERAALTLSLAEAARYDIHGWGRRVHGPPRRPRTTRATVTYDKDTKWPSAPRLAKVVRYSRWGASMRRSQVYQKLNFFRCWLEIRGLSSQISHFEGSVSILCATCGIMS